MKRTQWEQIAICIWIILAVGVGIKAIVSPERHSVWPVFSHSSRNFWDGRSLYRHYDGHDMYRYSPTFAIAVTPLAILPRSIGGAIWASGSVVLLFFALRDFHRQILSESLCGDPLGLFMLISALGTAPMIWNLQSNALLLALICWGTISSMRGRWWFAAFFLAAAIFIKLWPLAWAMVLVGTRPKKLALRLLIAGAALAAVPFLAGSVSAIAAIYREWWHILTVGNDLRWPGYRDAITLWELTKLPVDPFIYKLVQLSAGCAVALTTVLVERQTSSYRMSLTFGVKAWITWQLLLGPGSEVNTYSLLVPLLTWDSIITYRKRLFWPIPTVLLAILLLFCYGDAQRLLAKWFAYPQTILPGVAFLYACWLIRQFAAIPKVCEARISFSLSKQSIDDRQGFAHPLATFQ